MCPAHFFKAALRAQNSAHERKKAHTSALWKTAPVYFAFLHLQLEHFFAKRAVYTSSTYFCSFEDLGRTRRGPQNMPHRRNHPVRRIQRPHGDHRLTVRVLFVKRFFVCSTSLGRAQSSQFPGCQRNIK